MYRYIFVFFVFHLFVFGLVNSDVLVKKYLGCYRRFASQTLLPQTPLDQSMTIDLCIITCRNYYSTFVGLQKGNQCLCGEDFNELVSESNCTKECSGDNSQYCGGTNEQSITVYSVCSIGYFGVGCDKVCHCNQQAPCQRMTGKCPTGCDDSWVGQACDTANASPSKSKWYIGCYGDNFDRVMNGNSNVGVETALQTTTTNLCSSFCAQYNYTYMGTQFAWNCFCGESYSRYGPSRGCNLTCVGNNSQICGGWFANSVYSVCPTGSFSLNCLGRCNCFNETRCIYRNGNCPAGCESGWTGFSCSERDCNVANGGCNGPNELCETIDLKYATKTRCSCKEGYTRDKLWTNCIDIDECLDIDSFCGSDAYNCTNTIASFVCAYCSRGYTVQNGSCIESSTKTTGNRGSAESTDSYTRSVLIGAVVGTGFGMLIIGVLIGILIIKCRLKPRDEQQWNESKDADTRLTCVQNTASSTPKDSTVFEDYQALDRDKKGVQEPYAQLKDSIS